ncbi:uncharacterized protein LOC119105805 [Pollicipes pollicipes]|uniref:uncharacterized protein LOC119105805 n=1 Tax=Pollicipes pollicipes TaxID=41117 RepID=UPI0018854266|nr:uncharacterized protein LOC119105805 [Pollicipes pollicipes]
MRVLLAAVLAVAVAGGGAAPSASISLPAEHRLPAELVLPDTAHIPGQRLGEWGVDKFFSLWYIFALSDNVEVSKEAYTVLAPSNEAFDRVKLTPGFSGRDHIVNVLRNHIILGEVVTEERLKQLKEGSQLKLNTLLGTTAVFTSRAGRLYVNKIEIIGDILEITNASIVRTADYIPLPDTLRPSAEPDVAESPIDGSGDTEPGDLTASETASLPLLNEVGELSDPEPGLAVAHAVDPVGHEFATNNQRVKIPAVGKDSFVEAVEDALSLLRSGVGEFQGYFYDANITSMFSKDKEYTLFLPVNEAFQRFYPIDWGFNPFLVKEFTRETIMNHFAPGKLTSKDIKDGLRIKTMGGKELKFKKVPENILVNGNPLFLGDTPISHGNILFLDELLFVDYDVVAELRLQHRDKETAPLVAGVAGEALFLAHLIGELTHRENSGSDATFNKFIDYLYRSFDDIVTSVSNDYKYTFLALDDSAVAAALGAAGGDPLLADSALRDQLLLSHLVPERLYQHDLRDGFTTQTLGGQTMKVQVKDGETFINGARLLPRQEHVYNLGNVLFLESFPFISADELRQRAAQAGAAEPEGSGAAPGGLGSRFENVESFAGEQGSPDGVIREDGPLRVTSLEPARPEI